MADVILRINRSPVTLAVTAPRGPQGLPGPSGAAGTSSTAVWKDAVVAASTANISVAAPGAAIDGHTMAATERFLLKDQTAGAENGIYTWNGAATPATRAVDMDASAEFTAAIVPVAPGGTVNGNTVWKCMTNGPTVGTTAVVFEAFQMDLTPLEDQVAENTTNINSIIDIGEFLKRYTEASPDLYPVVWNESGDVFIGVDAANGWLIAKFDPDDPSLSQWLYANVLQHTAGLHSYEGDGNFFPLVWGNNGGVVLGFNAETQQLEGSFPSEGVAYEEPDLDPSDVVTYLTGGNWNGSLTYGQSLSIGAGASALSTTAVAAYGNKTFGSGPQSGKPANGYGAVNTTPGTTTAINLLEASKTGSDGNSVGESCCTSMASFLNLLAYRDNGILPTDLVSFCSAPGHGSYGIAQLEQGAAWYSSLTDHIVQAKARAVAAGKTFQLDSIVWLQGESDAGNGSENVTLQADYYAKLVALQSDIEADYHTLNGNSNPVHLFTYQTPSDGATAPSLNNLNRVRLAQLQADEAVDRIHLVGPCYHLLWNSSDGIHFQSISQVLWGRYVARARKAVLIDGKRPPRIRQLRAYARGQTVAVEFTAPQGPLVLDPNLCGALTDDGFKIVDGTGTLTLSNIRVVGTTVLIDIHRALGSSPKVRYAMDYEPVSFSIANGAGGNLRDSTLDTYLVSGTEYPLYHVCPTFELDITPLEAI